MKKQLFLITGALLALASCSQDETMDVNRGNAIDFRTAVGTRATETTNANITEFFVTALDANNVNFFTDEKFTKGNDDFFASGSPYYWPEDNSNLNFFAYSPAKGELGAAAVLTINKDKKELADFSPETVIADQVDFITANATGNKKDNEGSGVALEFKHRLSQIEIKAKSDNENYTFKVAGVRIGQPVSKGTFNFGTSAWTLGTDKVNYTYENENDVKVLDGTAVSLMPAVNDNAMLLPQQLTAWDLAGKDDTNTKKGAYLAVLVQITTKDGAQFYPAEGFGDYGWAAIPVNTEWVAGKKYVYTLDFTNGAGNVDPEKPIDPVDPVDPWEPGEPIFGSPIKFTVDVSDWEAPENFDGEVAL